MSNKQVIAIFIIGVGLLLGAFWAGLYVVKQDTVANANNSRASNQNSPGASSANQTSAGKPASANSNTQSQQASSDARYIVQVGSSFGTAEKANELTSQLRRKYPSAHTQNPAGPDTLYRVRIGPYTSREDAQQVTNELASQGFKGVMIFPWSRN
ncbi:MAG: SPOR domain-containing protein [Acidobacteriota bacterium]